MATASTVFGILAIFTAPFAVFSVPAIAFGLKARKLDHRHSKFGLVAGWVTLAPAIVILPILAFTANLGILGAVLGGGSQ